MEAQKKYDKDTISGVVAKACFTPNVRMEKTGLALENFCGGLPPLPKLLLAPTCLGSKSWSGLMDGMRVISGLWTEQENSLSSAKQECGSRHAALPALTRRAAAVWQRSWKHGNIYLIFARNSYARNRNIHSYNSIILRTLRKLSEGE